MSEVHIIFMYEKYDRKAGKFYDAKKRCFTSLRLAVKDITRTLQNEGELYFIRIASNSPSITGLIRTILRSFCNFSTSVVYLYDNEMEYGFVEIDVEIVDRCIPNDYHCIAIYSNDRYR